MTDEMTNLRTLLEKSSDNRLYGPAPDGAGGREQDRRRLRAPSDLPNAMATATGCGRRASAAWSCASPNSGMAATSQPSWSPRVDRSKSIADTIVQ
jgi:hypothetical protein